MAQAQCSRNSHLFGQNKPLLRVKSLFAVHLKFVTSFVLVIMSEIKKSFHLLDNVFLKQDILSANSSLYTTPAVIGVQLGR